MNASELDADIASGALPQFAMYIPNTLDDGHDSNVATADAWLQRRFEPLLDDPRFSSGTLFVVTFDEGRTNGDNVVYCVLHGAGVQPGVISNECYNHCDLLRTVEKILRTGSLHGHDEAAHVIHDIWSH